MNRFAPLTPEELSAATVAVMPAPDDGELVSPVPAGAPPPPRRHPSFGAPTMVWPYRDAGGGLLCEVHRYDPAGERKQFLPATCWRKADGEPEWRWKSIPSPRPLYGLDRLAANPGAPVIVTEGEKAADAASRIFRKSVCVTSLGGSQAAGKTDWAPLAGRKVMIWPDADAPGEKYAREVAQILHGLRCDVSIIDAPALARMSPDGGSREPIQGFDAADAIDEWPDAAALAKAAHSLARPCSVAADAPIPLFPALPKAERFPIEALGPVLSRAAAAISRKVQVPEAIAAQSVLAAAALAAQAHADVMLPYGQTRPLSLFFVTVAASGDRKSTADNEALWPIRKREKKLKEEHERAYREWKIAYAAWNAEKKKIEADKKLGLDQRRQSLADHRTRARAASVSVPHGP